MNCKEIKYKIEKLQLDERLPDDLNNHLGLCPSCSNFYALLKTVDRADEIWTEVHADEALPEKIISYVAEKTMWGKKRSIWPAISGIAASLLIGFFIGNSLFNASQNQNTDVNVAETEIVQDNYMTQTTDIMYYNAFFMEGQYNEK